MLVKLALDAATGLRYLHSKNITHFDVKSGNLLLAWETVREPIRQSSRVQFDPAFGAPSPAFASAELAFNGNAEAVTPRAAPPKPRRVLKASVADFGLSKFREVDKLHISLGPGGNPVGTIGWTAPEIYDLSKDKKGAGLLKDPSGGLSREPSGVLPVSHAQGGQGMEGGRPATPPTPPAGGNGSLSAVPNASGTAIYHPDAHQPRLGSSPGVSRRVDSKVDVYSFGVVMWEIWSRKEPYSHLEGNNSLSIMFHCAQGGRPLLPTSPEWREAYGDVPPPPPEPMPGWADLMLECWDRDPDRRPGFDIICRRLREGLEQLADDE